MSQVVNLNDPKVGYVSERDHSKRQFYPVFSITLRLLIHMELFLKLFMHTSFISLVGLPTLLHTEIFSESWHRISIIFIIHFSLAGEYIIAPTLKMQELCVMELLVMWTITEAQVRVSQILLLL